MEMQNQMSGRMPQMMQGGMMGQQHPQMMGQQQHPGMGHSPQMMSGGMSSGPSMQPHSTYPPPGMQSTTPTHHPNLQTTPSQSHHPSIQSSPLTPYSALLATPPQVEQPKLDNISKAKALVPSLNDLVSNVFRTAADAIYANNLVDSGTKPVEFDPNRFDKALEEFHSVCDHMEMHLKSSMECISQGGMSQQNLPTPVNPYPQFVEVVTSQIAYAKEVHDALAEAAEKMLE